MNNAINKVFKFINNKHGAITFIAILIPSVVVLHYFYLINKYSINFPYLDDYLAILHFIDKWILKPDINERLIFLFSQHNEHRIVFTRIAILFEYFFLGHINFRLLILFGNTALVIILIFLYKSFLFKQKPHIYYLIPVALLLFNFRYYEINFWAMASISSFWVLLFAILSLYYLFSKSNYSIYLAILFASFATFTIANGMMVFIAGAFVLFLNKGFLSFKKILWLSFGVIFMALFFFDYVKPGHHPDIIAPILNDPISFLGYIFTFLGSSFSNDIKKAMPFGFILAIFILYITYTKYYKNNPIIYSIIIFILITSVITALSRFGFGIEQSLSSRYTIYSTLLLVCCYMVFISLVYEKMNGLIILLFSLLAFTFNFKTQNKYLPGKIYYKKQFELYDRSEPSKFDLGWFRSQQDIPESIIRTSDSLGVFYFKHLKNYKQK